MSQTTAKTFIATTRFLGVYDNVLDHLARRNATVEKARGQGLSISTEDLQSEADSYRRVLGLHSAKETEGWLAKIGYSVDDFETEMEYRAIRRKKRETFSPAEVEAYFNDHRADFDRAKIAHLVVKNEGLAKEIAAQVKNEKKDFRGLALKHSLDDATREAGGYLGWVRRPALAALAPKVFAAAPGECLPPNKLGDLVQVIYVHDIKKAALDDDTKKEIKEALLTKWSDDLRAQVKLEIAG